MLYKIKDYLPSPESFDEAKRFFASSGFEAGTAIGNSFSIAASVSTFEHFFKVRLSPQDKSGIRAVLKNGSSVIELPLNVLPGKIKGMIMSVTFTPLPDFGPTDFDKTD